MTNERAIEILDPEHRGHYESIEPVNEACRIGMNAIKRVHELEAENAELRDRLSRAVELPCKVGDTIFYVQYFCDYKGCDSTTQQFCCGCKEMIEREKHKEKYVICEKSFVLKDLEKIGKKYFTTREAAEAKLAELKGGMR